MRRTDAIDSEIARLDPYQRIVELERENAALRDQRDRLIRSLTAEMAADGFAFELMGRGIRPPGNMRFGHDGQPTN